MNSSQKLSFICIIHTDSLQSEGDEQAELMRNSSSNSIAVNNFNITLNMFCLDFHTHRVNVYF